MFSMINYYYYYLPKHASREKNSTLYFRVLVIKMNTITLFFDLCYLRMGEHIPDIKCFPKCQANDAVPFFPPHAVAQNYYLPKHASREKKHDTVFQSTHYSKRPFFKSRCNPRQEAIFKPVVAPPPAPLAMALADSAVFASDGCFRRQVTEGVHRVCSVENTK